eukprot:TRINITY_DN17575_c0_g2_i1.p1 TRINITY_DN17575_c0_g2~~TRINITY_DN17575_c0_g2_i1.p1  ORF type:complete len:351 (-),score=104.43 TRINITY_DN17575_c0_g2_i1:462-1514(-)
MADTLENRQVVLSSYPEEKLLESHFEVKMASISPSDITEGEVFLQNLYLSLDPYVRLQMIPGGFPLGEPLKGCGVGKVLASKKEGVAEGDILVAMIGWESYTVIPASVQVDQSTLPFGGTVFKLSPEDAAAVPLSYNIGVLGMPGATAYFGLFKVLPPVPGETIFVSAASGAVGQLMGQLAKQYGCKTIGSAGSDDKVALLRSEFGYNEGFNYKTVGDYTAALRKAAPQGIDFYFDNVGGAMLEAALTVLNKKGRIVVCGAISGYEKKLEEKEPVRNIFEIVYKMAKIEGMLVGVYAKQYAEFREHMLPLLKDGKLNCREDISEGIESTPAAYIGLLSGKNVGKACVKIA